MSAIINAGLLRDLTLGVSTIIIIQAEMRLQFLSSFKGSEVSRSEFSRSKVLRSEFSRSEVWSFEVWVFETPFFFFRWNPLHEFFFTQILLFGTVKSWLITLFLCFINYSTLTTVQKDSGQFLMQNLFENVHTVREEGATWSGWLPCAICQSVPSRIPLPQPIIMMPYCIHQNSPSVVPATPKCQSKKKVPF